MEDSEPEQWPRERVRASLVPAGIWPLQRGGRLHPRDGGDRPADVSDHRRQPDGRLRLSLRPAPAPLHHQLLHPDHGVRRPVRRSELPGPHPLPPALLHRRPRVADLPGVWIYHLGSQKCFHGVSCLHQRGPLPGNNQASFLQPTGHPLSPENLHYFNLDLLLPDFLAFFFRLGETWLPR